MAAKDECYEIRLRCPDCKRLIFIIIPNGIEVTRFIRENKCPDCGTELEL